MNLSANKVGNIAMIFYGLVTALSATLIHANTQKISPLLSACNTFLFCLLIYSFFSFNTFKKIKIIQSNAFSIFMLNVTTAICWIFTFISLKTLPPELYLFTYLCGMPISGAFLFRTNLYKAILLLLGLLGLIITYQNIKLLPGLIFAFLGGLSGTVYSIYSKRVTRVLTSIEILSLRFYLTVVMTFFLCMLLGTWRILPPFEYAEFAVISLFSIVIPLALFQIGLKNLSVIQALSYMPLAPLICYGVNFLVGHGTFNFIQFGVILFLSLTLLIG